MLISEAETIIKRILPYLERRGYDIQKDLSFEESAVLDSNFRRGFIDISVTLGRKSPLFIIEAKRDGAKIVSKNRKQAIEYGKSKKCLFVALTNGQYFELLNVLTGKLLQLNDSAYNRIPTKSDLINIVIPQLKSNSNIESIDIPNGIGIPFRPGLPLTKLNHLIQQCHNTIRKIEKNEEHAFADFSKILFLKLLEEKWDHENSVPLYSYLFHELANIPVERADQVSNAIKSMIHTIKVNTKYGDVLNDPIRLKKDATYLSIVKKVSSVSWYDCNLDSKGTAFEYFVRATLKGKRLGQYFTPRPLVQLMLHLGRYKQILKNLKINEPFKVLDPACGTGGFLVFAMNMCLKEVSDEYKNKQIHKAVADKLMYKLKEETFFGIDAHEGVASSAKMNMIIAGDGHNNIIAGDSLKAGPLLNDYQYSDGTVSNKAHLILTNPPFGTSEAESLSKHDFLEYKIKTTRGQALFIQKMIDSVEKESRIVTVIDEGVLNTSSYQELRKHILQECRVEYIVSLPEETFKPNKINVKSSILVLSKRDSVDADLEDEYPIIFLKVQTLGYNSSGDEIKNFSLMRLIEEIEKLNPYSDSNQFGKGYNWKGFLLSTEEIINDFTIRFDYKYWEVGVREILNKIIKRGNYTNLQNINTIDTRRGNSPSSAEYVSEEEGFALVVKAGSNISKNGLLIPKGDFIEQQIYNIYKAKDLIVKEGDILIASTGEGTLGKCCVYRNLNKPAIADGHVTTIRVDQNKIYPEYLCDYLRKGFGAKQITRLYTGSTGLIELTPDDIDRIIISPLPALEKQIELSNALRRSELETKESIEKITKNLENEEAKFYVKTFKP